MTQPASFGPRQPLLDDAAIFQRATEMERLEEAWTKVLGNGGASGGDGISLARFLPSAPARLARLRCTLRDGSYLPGPTRRVSIPKKDGTARELNIPCVIDRVAQTALAMELAPLLDAEFEDASFGYRAGRSVAAAVARVRVLRSEGRVFAVDADIDNFFDSVPHEGLMARLGQSMSDGPATRLIGLWLEAAGAGGRGLAQGSPISPLLANLYLDRLDEAFSTRGARIVRFADDFLILTATRADAEAAVARARGLLAEHGLRLDPDKTRVRSFDEGFRFLGHLFVRSLVMAGTEEEETDEAVRLLRQVAAADAAAERDRDAAAEEDEQVRRGGLDPGQRVLYITAPDRRLGLRNQAFSVQEAFGHAGPGSDPAEGLDWREILVLPHRAVDRIEIGPRAGATEPALRQAMATGTPVAFVSGHGETLGWLAPRFGPRAGRHLSQARCVLDPERRFALARAIVDGRVRNQRALLRRLNRDRADPEVLRALAGLNQALRALERAAGLSALLGHEGHAASLFWPAFGRLLDEGFAFRERVRQNPPDAVNILLNATSSLLARDATVALERAGLHPGFGALHASDDYADAAVYDLMEEFRAPLSESVVAQALARRAVRPEHFVPGENGNPRLVGDGYAALIRAYERAAARLVASQRDGRRRAWRGIMLDQAQALAAHVEGRAAYAPYVLDY